MGAQQVSPISIPLVVLPMQERSFGTLMCLQLRYEDAENIFKRSLFILEKVRTAQRQSPIANHSQVEGTDSLAVSLVVSNLAEVYLYTENYTLAESMLRQAYAIKVRLHRYMKFVFASCLI